jgi:hypothetical protein
MKALASYQKTLREAALVGKSLGDAFAWYFYQNDPALLDEHRKRPAVPLMTTGTGGRAELEFAKSLPQIDKQFVLHHCVTSILRLGDVSLVQTNPLRVVAIGELKAGEIEGDLLHANVSFVGLKDASGVFAGIPTKDGEKGSTVTSGLSLQGRERLRRQLRNMDEAVKDSAKKGEDISFESDDPYYWGDLARAFESAPRRRFSYARLGGGLMVAIYRGPARQRLYSRLRNNDSTATLNDDAFPQCVASILVRGSPYNTVMIGGLHYGKKRSLTFLPGTIPLFWWGLPRKMIREIIFGEAAVITVFNPAPLLDALVKAGFTILSFKNPSKLCFRHEKGGRVGEWGDAIYWVHLIPNALFREEHVVAAILHTQNVIEQHQPRAKSFIRFNQALMPKSVLDGTTRT